MKQKTVIKWVLPGFCRFKSLNFSLINMLQQHPERFNDGTDIAAVYDSFPNQLWNGGRVYISDREWSKHDIMDVISEWKYTGVPIRMTYTNSQLKEHHLYSDYDLMITQAVADIGGNEILVNDPMLEDFIREKFPTLNRIISSTTRGNDIDATLREIESGKYMLVVLDYKYNSDMNLLVNEIPEGHRNRIELLVNEVCHPDCLSRKDHYKYISQCQLEHKNSDFKCRHPYQSASSFLYAKDHYPTFIKVDDVKFLADNGYVYFKIGGRGLSELDLVEAYVYYMVKPEFQDIARYELIQWNIIEIAKNNGLLGGMN